MDVEKDEQEIIERVAALDIGKAELVCCVRVPGPGRRRMQEVRTFSTMTRTLLLMADWLAGLGVSRVVMEATSDYWKPPFYLLDGSFETWLVNAGDVKHLPGRPKTGPVGRGVVVQGRRASDAAAEFRTTPTHPDTAGPDPLPGRPDRGADRGEAAGGEAA